MNGNATVSEELLGASMGPRSENRGYAGKACLKVLKSAQLQWVHGPRTVVMNDIGSLLVRQVELQWVHGPRTVVMKANAQELAYIKAWLQWVHGPRTVVML